MTCYSGVRLRTTFVSFLGEVDALSFFKRVILLLFRDFSATVEMTGGGLFEFSLEIATLTLAMTS